jgi:methyl-accepting chemotaxis protein
MKITRRQLRKIIREEKSKLLSEDITDHEMYQSDDELRSLGEAIENLVHWTVEANNQMDEMAMRYGELAANTTRARAVAEGVEELADRFDQALDEMLKTY